MTNGKNSADPLGAVFAKQFDLLKLEMTLIDNAIDIIANNPYRSKSSENLFISALFSC
jgi:hypothetical protein